MVNEFKLTVVHFARPNPMPICACAWILRLDKKTVENQDWAAGSSRAECRRTVPGHGPRTAGRRAAGPPRAVGRGPLGREPAFSKTLKEEIRKISRSRSRFPGYAELGNFTGYEMYRDLQRTFTAVVLLMNHFVW